MPQDVNIFGNCVAPRCFKSQILKASRNPVLRGQWQLSRKPSSKGKLLTALPLRSLFFPAFGERRRQTKDSYAKGRLKPNAYFDSFFFFFPLWAKLQDTAEEFCGTWRTTPGYFLRSIQSLSIKAEYISPKIQFLHSLKLQFEMQNSSLSI